MTFAAGYVLLTGIQGYACRITNVMSTLNVTPITNDSFETSRLSGNNIQIDELKIKPTGTFVIPNQLEGRTVTSIGNSAFEYQTLCEKIIIPNGVMNIGMRAFSSCTNLVNITIPNTVEKIGQGAFSYSKSLTNITIPPNVKSIEHSTFQECISLTNINIPNNLINIKAMAFYYCTNLKGITIPSSATRYITYPYN